jgi:hypothetical protein
MILWGTYAYRHSRTAPLESCIACKQVAVEVTLVERTSYVLLAPLRPRAFRETSRCLQCGRASGRDVGCDAPVRRAMRWRTALSWLLVAGILGCLGVGATLRATESNLRALSPSVGDRWNLDIHRWPGWRYEAIWDVTVEAVNAHEVRVAQCPIQAPDPRLPEYEPCYELDPIPVDAIPQLVEEGAIVSIRGGEDPMKPFELASGALGLLASFAGLFAWRTAHRSFREEPLARAQVV